MKFYILFYSYLLVVYSRHFCQKLHLACKVQLDDMHISFPLGKEREKERRKEREKKEGRKGKKNTLERLG